MEIHETIADNLTRYINELAKIADVIGITIQNLVDDDTFEDDTKIG